MSIQEISNAMASWSEKAQQEYIKTQEAKANTLSNSVEEGGFQFYNPWSWTQDYAQSEKSRFIANIDRAWIVQSVSSIITRLNQAETRAEEREAINKFYDLVGSLEESAPQSYADWINIEQTELQNSIKEYGSQQKRKWTAIDYATKIGLPLGGAVIGAYLARRSENQIIPTRQNAVPLVPLIAGIKALGWLKGGAVVIGSGLALSAGAAIVTNALYNPQITVQFDTLPQKVKALRSKVRDGQTYKGVNSRVGFYSAIGFPNSLRICAHEADQAKDQSKFVLYAASYATGDEQYADLAESLDGGLFSSSPFKDFNTAEVEMKKILSLLNQSPNQFVKMLAQDFSMISTATCMGASVSDAQLQKQGGGDACPDEDTLETILKTMEGLFLFGGKPCRMTTKQWRRVKMSVYIPLAIISLPYVMPILRPLGTLTAKSLEKLTGEE